MDESLERRFLFENYRSYVQILHDKGLVYHPLTDAELEQLPTHDLNQAVRQVFALARTPSS